MEKDLPEKLRGECLGILADGTDRSDTELYRLIDDVIEREGEQRYISLSERLRFREQLFNSFKKLDLLQELIDDPEITEIMINGKDNIFIEDKKGIHRWEGGFESEEKLENIIQQIVSRINRRVNTSDPIVDARLPDGSRVHVVLPPVALDGAVVTIRKFPEPVTMEKLMANKTLTKDAADFLKMLVRAKYNIFVSGGTSSGKTTLLNALSAYIPENERIITIEDSAELQIRHIPNIVRMETRNANSEGNGQIDMSMLIKASLRMRPDRIIVGEVRDKSAMDMLNAFDTGHDGSLSTGHANSCSDMLLRLQSMVLSGVDMPLEAVKQQIASAVDILVHLERQPDRSRKVVQITEVEGIAEGEILLNPLFIYERNCGKLVRCGDLVHTEKMDRAGIRNKKKYRYGYGYREDMLQGLPFN